VKLSTRNQLAGKVSNVKLGTIMAEVTVDLGGLDEDGDVVAFCELGVLGALSVTAATTVWPPRSMLGK
jgi:hypothetical protein